MDLRGVAAAEPVICLASAVRSGLMIGARSGSRPASAENHEGLGSISPVVGREVDSK